MRLESEVAGLDPQVTLSTNIGVERIERYDQPFAIARTGAVISGLLATLSFAVASVDRLLERRSHTATLAAIGLPRRVLRTSQIAQLLLPMTAALTVANLVGWLIAQGYLAVGGIFNGVPYGLLAQGLGASLIALLVAGTIGAIVSVPKNSGQRTSSDSAACSDWGLDSSSPLGRWRGDVSAAPLRWWAAAEVRGLCTLELERAQDQRVSDPEDVGEDHGRGLGCGCGDVVSSELNAKAV